MRYKSHQIHSNSLLKKIKHPNKSRQLRLFAMKQKIISIAQDDFFVAIFLFFI